MNQLINIGFGNFVNFDKVMAIVNPDSAPSKRLVQQAKEEERIIDATQGRRTKAILVLESNHIVLSALQPDTLTGRQQSDGMHAKGTAEKNE